MVAMTTVDRLGRIEGAMLVCGNLQFVHQLQIYEFRVSLCPPPHDTNQRLGGGAWWRGDILFDFILSVFPFRSVCVALCKL